jgi:DNA-binding CsgD family transcriptional regulator
MGILPRPPLKADAGKNAVQLGSKPKNLSRGKKARTAVPEAEFLRNLGLGGEVDVRKLVSSFGLTVTEAALAAILVRGHSIEAAAVQLSITTREARSHLKRIFMKTDLHSGLRVSRRSTVLES